LDSLGVKFSAPYQEIRSPLSLNSEPSYTTPVYALITEVLYTFKSVTSLLAKFHDPTQSLQGFPSHTSAALNAISKQAFMFELHSSVQEIFPVLLPKTFLKVKHCRELALDTFNWHSSSREYVAETSVVSVLYQIEHMPLDAVSPAPFLFFPSRQSFWIFLQNALFESMYHSILQNKTLSLPSIEDMVTLFHKVYLRNTGFSEPGSLPLEFLESLTTVLSNFLYPLERVTSLPALSFSPAPLTGVLPTHVFEDFKPVLHAFPSFLEVPLSKEAKSSMVLAPFSVHVLPFATFLSRNTLHTASSMSPLLVPDLPTQISSFVSACVSSDPLLRVSFLSDPYTFIHKELFSSPKQVDIFSTLLSDTLKTKDASNITHLYHLSQVFS